MKHVVAWALGILVVVGAATFLYVKMSQSTPTQSLNDTIKNSNSVLSFQPFYYRPAVKAIGGPNGYIYKNNSLVVDANLLSFQFINSSQQTIEVTMQPRPSDFDTESYPGRLQLNVVTGRAVLGTNTSSTTAAIFGDKTMLFVKAKQIIDDDTLRAFLAAFTLN